jgi:hypothetical protein
MPFEIADWHLNRDNRFPAPHDGEQSIKAMLILLDCPGKQQRCSYFWNLGCRRKARNNRQDMIPKCCQFPGRHCGRSPSPDFTHLLWTSGLRTAHFHRQFQAASEFPAAVSPSDLSDVAKASPAPSSSSVKRIPDRQLRAAVRSACCFAKKLRGANGSVPGRDQHHRTGALLFRPQVSRLPRCARFTERLTFKNASIQGLPKASAVRRAVAGQ